MANNYYQLISESGSPFSGNFVYAISLLSDIFKNMLFLQIAEKIAFLVVAVEVLACHDLLHRAQKQTY